MVTGDKITTKAPRSLFPGPWQDAAPASVAGGRRRHWRGAPARPLRVGRRYPAAASDAPPRGPGDSGVLSAPPLAIIASELTSGATAYRMGTGGGTGGGVGSVARRPSSEQKQRKKIIDNLEIEDG